MADGGGIKMAYRVRVLHAVSPVNEYSFIPYKYYVWLCQSRKTVSGAPALSYLTLKFYHLKIRSSETWMKQLYFILVCKYAIYIVNYCLLFTLRYKEVFSVAPATTTYNLWVPDLCIWQRFLTSSATKIEIEFSVCIFCRHMLIGLKNMERKKCYLTCKRPVNNYFSLAMLRWDITA